MRHKLYLQIYFAFLAGLLLFALMAGITWKIMSDSDERFRFEAVISMLLTEAIPENAPLAKSKQTLEKFGREFKASFSLYGRDGQHLVSTAGRLPLPKDQLSQDGFHHHEHGTFVLRLSDGRWLVASRSDGGFPGALPIILLMLAGLGIVAYPLAKRLTCRLEHLQQQVDAFGQGNLSARARISGKDEIAALALRFNHAADRLEKLIEAQQHMLRGASHELRTPLTRMRMAVELMDHESIGQCKSKLEADIAELDNLVDELLLASKLDAGSSTRPFEAIDLLGLAAEVASAYEAEVSGASVTISGDEQMLRRLLRNLLENAGRYRVKAPIEVSVTRQSAWAIIRVCDDGPGIPESDREKIFEPFFQSRISGHDQGSIGLGLSLVRKIARQHGGDVRYLDAGRQGACFEVTLGCSPHAS
ncbi:MAG: sensor histidine kinase [Zetaproteobacteria bacterium CG_4_9_14_3_um_filter_49_83]|nr:MAG: hypothetical protein AUJ56_02385 [Zetaproteobacteria bacterium CG1_02_49_23]PIQ30047.1 MAG: two-component sensor histidine kinase [Zetaproteobacteria bacterium CG17_big_fil_post_rev_8_21_14_2_50_50_13]PIV29211.1 MAG: sensor histidine kinase [Zetaproteobacteria bacterium CG02_land_8_20_14_3_00_50_9]PIY56005.1 MAG: sensor histidine kinase [Zetaproteobacteria bacterium CG_4_10_14_0_8_um_filter_49_80]PJA36319.1 MAG: sensor histidine kinase [Zetaproteobacteria bacterium CG_4_9_14_3_um_filter